MLIALSTALLSQFVLPEMLAHAFLTLCFLLSGQWIAFLVNAPLVGYNVNKSVSTLLQITEHETTRVLMFLRQLVS